MVFKQPVACLDLLFQIKDAAHTLLAERHSRIKEHLKSLSAVLPLSDFTLQCFKLRELHS